MDLEPIEVSIKQAVLDGEFADKDEGIAEVVAYLQRRDINKVLETSQVQIDTGQYRPLAGCIRDELNLLD